MLTTHLISQRINHFHVHVDHFCSKYAILKKYAALSKAISHFHFDLIGKLDRLVRPHGAQVKKLFPLNWQVGRICSCDYYKRLHCASIDQPIGY